MRRKIGFVMAKRSIRGLFFSIYWSTRMLSRFVRYLQEIKEDAMTDKGNCPYCKSYDIQYSTPEIVENNRVRIPFNCNECGRHGQEHYRLKYLKSFMKKEEENGTTSNKKPHKQRVRKTRTIRKSPSDSIRTTETDKPTDGNTSKVY